MRYCPIYDFLGLMGIAGEYGDFHKLYGNTKREWKPSSNVLTLERCDILVS